MLQETQKVPISPYRPYESVSGRKSRELGRIFSQVLAEAQDEGIALVIYERQQTVYHFTVGRAM